LWLDAFLKRESIEEVVVPQVKLHAKGPGLIPNELHDPTAYAAAYMRGDSVYDELNRR
jgi:hypothetical protein